MHNQAMSSPFFAVSLSLFPVQTLAQAQATKVVGEVVKVMRGAKPTGKAARPATTVSKPHPQIGTSVASGAAGRVSTESKDVSGDGAKEVGMIGGRAGPTTRPGRRPASLPGRAKPKPVARADDPVFIVQNQSVTIDGMKLEGVTITARRSTLVLMLKSGGTFKLTCNDLQSPYVDGLPPSIRKNATRASLSMKEKHVSIFIPNAHAFASLVAGLPIASAGGGSGPPPPPRPNPFKLVSGGPPPTPPEAPTAEQSPTPPPAGDACKVAGKICYDPVNNKASASVSCDPVSVSLDTKGDFSVSVKVVG